jgi:phage terminase Nu1 subunit (DNA packaging protein)
MEKLNSSQLSKAFQVSKVTIRNWIDKGCPSTKTDKGHEFILSDVIKWHQGRYLKSVQPDEFQKSKATREHFKALLTELEYKERSGELISSQDVKELMFSTARLTRDSILNIPGHLSALLVNQTREKIHAMLAQELRQALENLANKFVNRESLENILNESEVKNEVSTN